MRCRFLLLLFLIAVSVVLTGGLAAPQPPQAGQRPLLVLLVPGLALEDLPGRTALPGLFEGSAVGLMNCTGEGPREPAAAYLSLSAGFRAACPEKEGGLSFQQHEILEGRKAKDVYSAWLGTEAQDAEVVMPHYRSIQKANAGGAKPGLLADALKEAGVPVLFIGNQDLPGTVWRPGALVAADSKGTITEGWVDARTRMVDDSFPTYYITNYPFFYEKTAGFLKCAPRPGVVFLDLGDLARLDAVSDYLAPEVYTRSRESALTSIMAFIERIAALADETGASLLLVAPFPKKTALLAGNMLTPVICRLPGESASILTSASTKRLGLVTNLDIAPTILSQAGVSTFQGFAGRPLQAVPNPAPLQYLKSVRDRAVTNHRHRPIFLKIYVLLQIAVVFLAASFVLLRHSLFYRMGPLFLLLTGGPLFFLLLPVAGLLARAATLFLYGSLTLLVLQKRKPISRLAILYLSTAAAIALDILLGAPLMKSSLLGYDPISGARYYGLGNEYMGVLLGSSSIGLALLAEILNRKYPRYSRSYRPALLLAFGFLTILVAAPQWGTNVGGAISFAASLALLAFSLCGPKPNFRLLLAAGLCCIAAILILFYADLHRPAEVQSHIGLTARMVREEGFSSLLPVIIRKVKMNAKLVQYSLWTRVFLSLLGASALIFRRPPGVIKTIFSSFPYLKAGFNAGLAGCFAALLVNDSGIVAAAACSIYVVLTLFYLIAEQAAEN